MSLPRKSAIEPAMIRFPSALRRSKPDIAVDFGTSNLRLVSRDGGIIFDEPSLCCF